MTFLADKLGYDKNEPLQFLNKRLCGIWLIWIGVVLTLSIYKGGKWLVHPIIFVIGFGAGFLLILNSKYVEQKLSYGPESLFQKKISQLSITLMFILIFFMGGYFIPSMDFRMIWLGALLAVAIHFVPFGFVHGKLMVLLAAILIGVLSYGYLNPSVPFYVIGYVDAVIKLLFGFTLLFSRPPA
ncbi:DUF6609 family protein [Halobacillus sp. K22]|uniref:DUF6609 family protein n=1 Tax=Halobacillus sp. K22 TaxID=3457431 RepID=UPI003FCC30BF